MSDQEQRSRMKALRKTLKESPVQNWGEQFIRKLEQISIEGGRLIKHTLSPEKESELLENSRVAEKRLFIFDYDGTLMPLMSDPDSVLPDDDLLGLLTDLTNDPANDVLILSGRPKHQLGQWFSNIDMTLVAEHGAWMKATPKADWIQTLGNPEVSWKGDIRTALEALVEKIPGSFIEEKEFSLVWHYRKSDPDLAGTAAKDLVFHLLTIVGENRIRILPGSHSIEIRCIEVGKGRFVQRTINFIDYDFIFASGDDLTDEDLFAALPDRAQTMKVGTGFSRAQSRVKDPLSLRQILMNFTQLNSSNSKFSSESQSPK